MSKDNLIAKLWDVRRVMREKEFKPSLRGSAGAVIEEAASRFYVGSFWAVREDANRLSCLRSAQFTDRS